MCSFRRNVMATRTYRYLTPGPPTLLHAFGVLLLCPADLPEHEWIDVGGGGLR